MAQIWMDTLIFATKIVPMLFIWKEKILCQELDNHVKILRTNCHLIRSFSFRDTMVSVCKNAILR